MLFIHGNADKLLVNGPAQVEDITITGVGGAAVVTLYDGVDANGTVIARLSALSGTSFYAPGFAIPPCRSGLYVVVGANTAYYSIMVRTARELDGA